MATQVSVVTAATGVVAFYSTYAGARSAASSGDLIQIWADLYDEKILLKNNVDIWIAPGRIIQTTESEHLITDKDGGSSTAVNVKITGNGFLKNMSQKYSCVAIFNQNSRVYIECESLESNGYEDDDESATVYFENAASITILAKKIYNSKRKAISFANEVSDINIKVGTIEGGYYDEDFTGGDTITIRGSGYLTANEVISNSNGSCLAHKAGNFTANILKLTTTLNRSDSPNATVELSGGTGDQILTLQCDEIKATHAVCVKQEEGFLNLKARSIYSVYALSMDLSANADIEAVDIVSDSKGINIHNSSSQKIIIDANSIIGSNGNDGVVRSSSGSNYVLRNAKIKNTFTTGDSVCIYIESGNTNVQNIEIENIILVTGNSLSGKPIYRPGTNTININNYGLFVNRVIDRTLIILKIGTGTEGNYKFIQSSDIT